MNKQLSIAELSGLMSTITPDNHLTPPRLMSRREKLEHWASLIVRYPRQITMLHGVEYMNRADLRDSVAATPNTIFAIAAGDRTLQAQGLNRNDPRSVTEFFNLSLDEIHYLSCDCHGHVTNSDVATRMRSLANHGSY